MGSALVLPKSIVGIAVQPSLARLSRRNDGMTTRVGVFGCMAVWRRITAQRDVACLARPQMNPFGARLYALFADARFWLLNTGDFFDVRAYCD
jgi:hypothetical protein